MRIGQVELGKIAVTVGSLTGDVSPREEIEKIDIFETRLDLFENRELSNVLQTINSLKSKFKKPLIATVRSSSEGSSTEISDVERFNLYSEVIPLVDAIDVELSSKDLLEKVLPLCKENGVLLISSYHNFENTPQKSEMEAIVRESKEAGSDIVKIAAKANSKKDVASLLEFTINNKDEGIVTISMGEVGLISRIVNPLLGSLLTYGYVSEAVAPGQISVFDIIDELQFFDPQYRNKF